MKFATAAAVAAMLSLAPLLGHAQQPGPQPSPAVVSLGAALQQLPAAVQLYDAEMRRELAAKDGRIADLEKLCGDPCKAKPGDAAKPAVAPK